MHPLNSDEEEDGYDSPHARRRGASVDEFLRGSELGRQVLYREHKQALLSQSVSVRHLFLGRTWDQFPTCRRTQIESNQITPVCICVPGMQQYCRLICFPVLYKQKKSIGQHNCSARHPSSTCVLTKSVNLHRCANYRLSKTAQQIHHNRGNVDPFKGKQRTKQGLIQIPQHNSA